MAKVPYRDAHIFALERTPHRILQQLPRARMAPRAMRLKDIMLDFTAPEVLVFHLSIQNGFFQLLSPLLPPNWESVVDVAASRPVAAIHAMNNGVPGICQQNSGNIGHGLPGPFSRARQALPRRTGFHLGAPTAAATRCGSSLIGAVSR
ncbi:hypothetical protein TcYC6_0034180 [Trypanosoma cruzi]|nr:hypothetical protein TcYC6_0034270 [Trypanosoma cruzi]KAF8288501.1 hypothetical protein TcYC6_0034300 [Trypanosoma cruzi]KAF8288513.1 hypothetical protein TcYC6_0034180 [Trypanosoma cruzi]